MTEIESHIANWIRSVSEIRPELSGFAVFPFSSRANYKVVECNAKDIEPISGYDVVIYAIEDDFTLENVQEWVEYHNNKHEDWLFFEDCASYDTYVGGIQTNNGKYNLILMQSGEDLRQKRLKLAKTKYYDHWDDDYLKEILGDDYEIVKNSG